MTQQLRQAAVPAALIALILTMIIIGLNVRAADLSQIDQVTKERVGAVSKNVDQINAKLDRITDEVKATREAVIRLEAKQ